MIQFFTVLDKWMKTICSYADATYKITNLAAHPPIYPTNNHGKKCCNCDVVRPVVKIYGISYQGTCEGQDQRQVILQGTPLCYTRRGRKFMYYEPVNIDVPTHYGYILSPS